jgi:predicted aspartyl protease
VLGIGPDSLPAWYVEAQSGTELRTTFSDWRPVDGVLWPFTSTQSTGDPRFDVTLRTTSAAYPASLPPDAIPRPVTAIPRDVAFLDPEAAANIAVNLIGSLVIVPLEVDGTPGRFLLDTGAGASVIARAFVEKLGLTARGAMEARGAAGSETAAFVDVGRIAVPGVELRDQTVVTVALRGVADAVGTPIDGILGYDFLSRFAVEIDYAARRLGLFPSGGYEGRPGASRIALRVEANVPRVDGRLDGKHAGSFVLDTGNNWPLLLHSPFVRRHGLAPDDTTSVPITGVGGLQSMRRGTVETLALGDTVFRDVRTLLASADEGAVALDEAIGNVGGALFANRVLAFDYGAGALWIASSASAR